MTHVHFLADPYAPHPVVNRNICYGGGGGGSMQAPDYSQYISKMTALGEEGMGWARDLVGWAKSTGVDLMAIAKGVGQKSGAAADTQQATSDRLMKSWEDTYGPLYQAQAADAKRMIGDLPATEEHYAGKFSADTAQALDQAKQTQQRNLRSQGFAPSAVATGAIDTMAGLQRAAAVTQAGEAGRYAARTEARDVTGKALTQGQFVPGVGAQQGQAATTNRALETSAPNAAAGTAASLYGPAAGFYSSATPYFKEWGNATNMGFQNQMDAEGEEDNTMADIMGGIGAVGGTVAGAYFGGPAGAQAGGAAGGAAGKAIGGAFKKGGKIPPMGRRVPRGYAQGGAIDTGQGDGNYVDPSLSPSGGEEVDDVEAMVSAGEFVIPERTVDWFGEKYFQNLIAKSDKDRETQTVAAPEEGPMPEEQSQGFAPEAPIFRSEGARV